MKSLTILTLSIWLTSCTPHSSNVTVPAQDTIITSQLDLSVTYSDAAKHYIIYRGKVYFRSDITGNEKEARVVIDTLNAMIKRADDKINPK